MILTLSPSSVAKPGNSTFSPFLSFSKIDVILPVYLTRSPPHKGSCSACIGVKLNLYWDHVAGFFVRFVCTGVKKCSASTFFPLALTDLISNSNCKIPLLADIAMCRSRAADACTRQVHFLVLAPSSFHFRICLFTELGRHVCSSCDCFLCKSLLQTFVNATCSGCFLQRFILSSKNPYRANRLCNGQYQHFEATANIFSNFEWSAMCVIAKASQSRDSYMIRVVSEIMTHMVHENNWRTRLSLVS